MIIKRYLIQLAMIVVISWTGTRLAMHHMGDVVGTIFGIIACTTLSLSMVKALRPWVYAKNKTKASDE